jgi:UDP-glucose 4-epimerase
MKGTYSRILVTGGAGFIGSHIVDRLLSKGFEVTVLDSLINGQLENIFNHQGDERFHFVKSDIRDLNEIREIMKNQDMVFHEAAITDITYSIKHPLDTNAVNTTGTLGLLESCVNSDVTRVIFASSSSVYGGGNAPPFKEEMPLNPGSPYAISKLAAEHYINMFHELYGLETVILRYFNVYGSRARANQGVISIFINQLLKNMNPVIYGDGEQTRDYVNVQDVVDANVSALSSRNAVGETINIGTGTAISLNRIVDMMLDSMNEKLLSPIYSNPRQGDVKHGYADIGKAEKLLDFHPKVSLEEGINQLIKWYSDRLGVSRI